MTLPEVMIAGSILLVCLVSLAGLLGGSITSSSSAKMRDEAANLANLRIESARSLTYDRVGVRYASGLYGDPAGDIRTPETIGKFVVTTSCSWVRTAGGRAAYKKVTVRVSWQQPVPSSISVTTLIYGKSALAVTGDLDVRLRYREDGAFVPGATVAIRALDGAQRAVVSDADGVAFFGQVAIGAVAVTVTPPEGCVVDTSTLASAAIAPDAVSTIIVYVQRPAQATVRVTDTNGTPIGGASVTLTRADGAVMPAVVSDAGGDAVVPALLYGEYSAAVAKAGYTGATVPVSVTIAAPAPVVGASISQVFGVGIHVKVFDVNSTQLSGSTVTVRDAANVVVASSATAVNGEVSFTGLDVGVYGVTVDTPSYVSQSRSTTLHDAGDIDTLLFYLVPASTKGNIQITSRNDHGTLTSLRIVVKGPNNYNRNNLWTDVNGAYTLTDLVPGSYTVKCHDNSASTVTVIVNGDQTADAPVSQDSGHH